jgi:translation initiation factor 3 subunit A
MHVEQLEKDKRELAERMRVIGKWLDHVERAYRKEERPLLAKDYESQQENDRLTFETLQKSRVENSKQQHQLNLETKARLSRMLGDFNKTKDEILERRGQEYAEKQREASDKLREAKAKRTAAVRKAREEERLLKEAEEQKLREREEEEARREAGALLSLPLYLTWVMTLYSRAPCGRGTGTPRERSRGSRGGSQEEGGRGEAHSSLRTTTHGTRRVGQEGRFATTTRR